MSLLTTYSLQGLQLRQVLRVLMAYSSLLYFEHVKQQDLPTWFVNEPIGLRFCL